MSACSINFCEFLYRDRFEEGLSFPAFWLFSHVEARFNSLRNKNNNELMKNEISTLEKELKKGTDKERSQTDKMVGNFKIPRS